MSLPTVDLTFLRQRTTLLMNSIAFAAAFAFCAVALAQTPMPDPPAGAQMPQGKRAPVTQRAFATPDDAGRALIEALESDNNRAIFAVLGRGSGKLISSGDPVQDKGMRAAIVKAYTARVKYELNGDAKVTILLGEKDFPFPYPLVRTAAGWQFDAKTGAEEIINRRIGRNELAAMKVCLAYVDAQREYVLKDRNDNGLLEYAQRLVSSPGAHDGLYWPAKEGEPASPLGPLGERAQKAGYGGDRDEPYHGYFYRILTAQGADAAGGAYDYIVDGKMIGGFALVAWPARWSASGVMTFVCNHDGVVYEKNLGSETAAVAKKMSLYNPDSTWKKAEQQ